MTIEISTDKALLDVPYIHRFLSEESAWASGIELPLVQKAIANSLCFGAYENNAQIGFARVVTDYASFGYLCDVFVATNQRGRGISRLLIDAVLAHEDIQGLRRFTLVSTSARELYRQYGWTALHVPEGHMERFDPEIYKR